MREPSITVKPLSKKAFSLSMGCIYKANSARMRVYFCLASLTPDSCKGKTFLILESKYGNEPYAGVYPYDIESGNTTRDR